MVWLTPDEVAKRIGVCRRTAIKLMGEMRHSNVGGTERKRIRVSEDALDAWMIAKQTGVGATVRSGHGGRKAATKEVATKYGTNKRLPRRAEL